jgi:metaxin
MPPKATPQKRGEDTASTSDQPARSSGGVRNFFSIPSPVRRLFDKVPMVVYTPNELPQRAPKSSRIPSLYVFSTEKDAAAGRPSFNPSCLKWQVSRRAAIDIMLDHILIEIDIHEHRWGRSSLNIFKQSCLTLGFTPISDSCGLIELLTGVTITHHLQ